MEHLDRLIPLAILLVVAAFVLFLLRRSAREKDAAPRTDSAPTAQIPVALLIPIAAPVAPVKINRKRPVRKPPAMTQTAPAQTPIHTVLGLLKEKDTLAAAFLLREILAPPVSQRQCSPHAPREDMSSRGA